MKYDIWINMRFPLLMNWKIHLMTLVFFKNYQKWETQPKNNDHWIRCTTVLKGYFWHTNHYFSKLLQYTWGKWAPVGTRLRVGPDHLLNSIYKQNHICVQISILGWVDTLIFNLYNPFIPIKTKLGLPLNWHFDKSKI